MKRLILAALFLLALCNYADAGPRKAFPDCRCEKPCDCDACLCETFTAAQCANGSCNAFPAPRMVPADYVTMKRCDVDAMLAKLDKTPGWTEACKAFRAQLATCEGCQTVSVSTLWTNAAQKAGCDCGPDCPCNSFDCGVPSQAISNGRPEQRQQSRRLFHRFRERRCR